MLQVTEDLWLQASRIQAVRRSLPRKGRAERRQPRLIVEIRCGYDETHRIPDNQILPSFWDWVEDRVPKLSRTA